jgi:hypothetical protein
VSPPDAGFDYGNAGVGAGVMDGMTLIGVAVRLTVRRRAATHRDGRRS